VKEKWFKLDNAAKIYPAFASKKDPATFRLAAVLHEEVHYKRLQEALNETLPMFPSMAVTLRQGLFWYYLDENPKMPMVEKESKMPCTYINLKKSNGYLFQVYYYKKRISIECFHALTDGYGAMEFLKALLYNYLKQKHSISADGLRLNGNSPEDVEDSYKKYATEDHSDTDSVAVKHINGTPTHIEGAFVHHGIINASEVNQVAKTFNTTITVFLTALYLKSLMSVIKEGPIVVAIPVNLRKMFPSKTLRNFSYVINVKCEKDESLEKMIEIVSSQFIDQLDKNHLQGQFSKNVDFENNMALKLTPNVIKSVFLKQARTFKSKKVVTSILSNPGIVKLPETMIPYVNHFECVLYASTPHCLNMGIATFNNKMVISLSRNIKEKHIIDDFYSQLKKTTGLDIELHSNEGV